MGQRYLSTASLICTLCCVLGGHHMHLGCYKTPAPGVDMDGLRYYYARLELGTCAAGCSQNGYAYIALQGGKQCICLSEYGRGGLTYGSDCSMTCNTDRRFSCGGHDTENIYYAVDTDRQVLDEREDIVHTTSLTFQDARKDCVRRDGDLVTLRGIFQMDTIISMANKSGIESPFWIGLYRTSWRKERHWTIPNVIGIDSSESSMYWDQGQPQDDNYCTVIDPAAARWRSVPCSESHPYVCFQVPPLLTQSTQPVIQTTPTTENLLSAHEAEDPFWTQNKYLILYILMPIFLSCYGGSCVAYTVYKGYRACKKKTRRKVVSSYPRTVQRGNGIASSSTAPTKSRPITPGDVSVNEDETQPPPYSRTAAPARKRAPPQRNKVPSPEVVEEPEEPEIDFTKLSIADILYIRALLGMETQRNRKKKILTT